MVGEVSERGNLLEPGGGGSLEVPTVGGRSTGLASESFVSFATVSRSVEPDASPDEAAHEVLGAVDAWPLEGTSDEMLFGGLREDVPERAELAVFRRECGSLESLEHGAVPPDDGAPATGDLSFDESEECRHLLEAALDE